MISGVGKSIFSNLSGNLLGWSGKVLGGLRGRKNVFFGPRAAHRVLAGPAEASLGSVILEVFFGPILGFLAVNRL